MERVMGFRTLSSNVQACSTYPVFTLILLSNSDPPVQGDIRRPTGFQPDCE